MISCSSSQHYAVVNYYSKMEFHKCHRTVIKADLSQRNPRDVRNEVDLTEGSKITGMLQSATP